MTTESIRMSISIQKDLALDLKKLTSPRKRSSFINEAIRQKLEQQKKEELEVLLEEGYKNRYQENIEMTGEFTDIDVENWDDY
jgi:metal-responsive CopG/Arc/MetJ family transcriptional regulator